VEHAILFVKNKSIYLEVKDHSVSHETFQLIRNESLDLLETSPQPAAEKLPDYYKSDDYISHTNSKRNLLENVYHQIRKISLRRKLKLINSLQTKGNRILDIGCGTGDFLKITKDHNWNVLGIEPNDTARKIANSKTDNSVYRSAYLDHLSPNSFDVITLWHVLEHLPDLNAQLSRIKLLLKQDGALIIAVPNYKSYDADYYSNYWAAYDVPRHVWHFSQEAIKNLVSDKQMVVEKTLPMLFDAYYVALLSEKYKTGKMNPLNAFWIGFKSNLRARRTSEYSSLIYVIKNEDTSI
jgi:2-polyprenyl-3-methyl-5-hydroxy-6-metoxy-1,4-benzoquinol methylase